jgi:hypothetical protein
MPQAGVGSSLGFFLGHRIRQSQDPSTRIHPKAPIETDRTLGMKKVGTVQIPVDSFNETSGGGRMVIATSNRYDSSTSTTNQRQNDEVYETP